MKAFFKSPTFKKILKKITGEKKKSIDPALREFDCIWIGGLHSANMVKYFQHKHFHGIMAAANTRVKFYNEHLYEFLQSGNMKGYKYISMPFSSNFEVNDSKYIRERIKQIHPEENKIVTEKGDVYSYKALVLNTGLDQSSKNMPFINNLVNDEFAKTRVFVHETGDSFQIERNKRIFQMHKDNDFIVYLPEFPSRREAYDNWYLATDAYLTRGLFCETHNRNMKVRVITPNNVLFKFPFANEVMMEEITKRTMIECHFGYKLVDVEVSQHLYGYKRIAVFKNTQTGEEMRLNFGTLLLTPENKKREIYEGNDLADKDGQVTVNPYTLQHTKYQNIFAFGDCANVPTTKGLYATLNQGVVVRNNLWDYLHGNDMKGIYEGYSSFAVHHTIDRQWIFKHKYNYEPLPANFYVPRFLGYFAFKLKNSMEKNYLSKIFQKKANFGYPYLQKDRYFRPLNENKFLKNNKISIKDVIIHHNIKPILSFEKEGHGHGHALAH
jgi:sulfide:quinone oxidoreductase